MATSPLAQPVLDELADRIGASHVLLGNSAAPSAEASLDAYEHPARGTGGRADAVVRPVSTDDVRAVVLWAIRHGVSLIPQGANTGLVGASVPPVDHHGRPVVVLSTGRMTSELEIHADDRVAVVSAGVRLSALNAAIEPIDLALPIDLAADPSIGGMVSTNTGGARMLHDGDMRSHVLGLEAVLADDDATVLDDLSRLRKDSTGPRPSSLLIGSGGAFGIVTRVAVSLSRRPRERECALLAVHEGADVLRALRVLEGSLGSMLSAFEVMSRPAVDATVGTVERVRTPWPGHDGPAFVVLVEASGPVAVAEAMIAAMADVAASGAVADAVLTPAHDAWGLRHAISEGLARTGTVVGFDVSVPRSELVAFRDDVRARVADALPHAIVADFGHWADGGTHCNLVFRDAPPSNEERATARGLVFSAAVHDHSGSYSAEHGIGPHNADWWRSVTPPATQRLVREVRDVCDPHRVLGHPDLPF